MDRKANYEYAHVRIILAKILDKTGNKLEYVKGELGTKRDTHLEF